MPVFAVVVVVVVLGRLFWGGCFVWGLNYPASVADTGKERFGWKR